MNSDVLIVGGGVIGLSIARELHKRGIRRLTIVDRGPLGMEASWAAAGMLAPNVEVDADLTFHRFCVESLALYPDFCSGLLDETSIDAELDTSGTLFLSFTDKDVEELANRYRRLDRRGSTVQRLSAASIRELEPLVSDGVREGLYFPNDWQVENRRLLLALRRYTELNGVRIIENEDISELLTDGARVIGARSRGGEHLAETIVLATGAWTSLIKLGDAPVPFDIRPIRGQMICLDSGHRQIGRVLFSPRGYVTPRADGRVLVGATVEDVGYEKSVSAHATASLVNAGLEIAPRLGEFPITEEWAGLRPHAADGFPVIGEVAGHKGVLFATGHYRNGILLAPITAKIIAEKIVDGRDSIYFDSFGVERLRSPTANVFAV